ncbi:MAG TPA: YbdK family carboxylate-amine ligase [Solirubrobacteraceae bacterium]|nr:YbdK family carboxylate-amine ligase [Solirubrobacteraceae bacterium]
MTAPADLRHVFEAERPMTVGLEEELMVLDPATLDLVPRARELLAVLGDDQRAKPELPEAQLEILSTPCATVAGAAAQLAGARRDLAAAAAGVARLAAGGAHPFAAPEGPLNPAPRYATMRDEYGPVARRQLVFGLHVHVAVGGCDRALAVYNALRSHLPELAALGANAPFHGGRDTGLASVRPTISETLPRQGVPPAFASWAELAGALAWGSRAGALPDLRLWWWELRLHPLHGTVEVRVPDAQGTVGETAALGAVVHALIADLAHRHDDGELLPVAATWRIEHNRWSALRHGLDGTLADLETGQPAPTRERVDGLLERLHPAAREVGCEAELATARALARSNGAQRQREAAAGDPHAATAWLAERFLA